MPSNIRLRLTFLLGCIVWTSLLFAQDTDVSSTPADTIGSIGEVVVRGKLVFREVVPSQKLGGKELERMSSHSIADALRYFSGIQLKDYGGVGGIKTVNIRSMGTHHLGIYYDGIELGNAQNGQIDLGQFSLDNVEEVTLYNGQKSAIFQTASDFGNAGSVYIRTRRPRFLHGERQHLRFKATYGSSDLFRSTALWEQKLNDDVSASLSAGFVTASGKYKFRYRRFNLDHTVAWDTTATRQNGDIHAERVEANLHGVIDQGYWHVKGYLYNSARGIPGAIVNNVWRRGERQGDLNTFVQGAWQKSFGDRYSTRVMGKWAYYRTHYENNDPTLLPVDNKYYQQEFYLTTSHVYEVMRGWSVSMSYDARYNKLNATTYRFARPTRWSHLVSLATGIDFWRVKAQASILYSFIHDRTRLDNSTNDRGRFTPALFVNVFPFSDHALSLRAYVKESFRMPTFNDLYYTDLGNASLRPERATQYDIGMMYDKSWQRGALRQLSFQIDGYYNHVTDKIVAYPKGQQFRWTMLNMGKVKIHGIDVGASATLAPLPQLLVTGRVQYTYQDARDVTDPDTPYYKDQLPYIPWHSGSLILGATWKGWGVNYSFIYAGERYNEPENIIYNHMEPWYTNDLGLTYERQMGKMHWKATLEVNNLLSQDYDVIVNYPMPKRNYALSLELTL
ncbi:MAG: TonB-dependent receptor [Prevotella sp.]|nr:TonB-dependent receptor [Prevotella sp.]